MARLFISYSREDDQFLDQFVALIEKVYVNNSLWLQDDIHGGADRRRMIQDEVGKSDLFIYLISNESLGSPDCQSELREALRLGKPILPVIVHQLNPPYPGNIPPDLAEVLRRTQYVDLSGGFSDPITTTSLYAAINRLLNALPVQPITPTDLAIRVAIISGVFGLLAAIITGAFGLWGGIFSNQPSSITPSLTITESIVAFATTPAQTPTAATPTPTPDRAATLDAAANTPMSTPSASHTATPTSSFTATITPTSGQVALIPLVVRSLSGNEIGNGTLRVYHPDSVDFPATIRINLELSFDNYYITPTPFGPRTVVPANTGTPRLRATESHGSTPTPLIPRFESSPGEIEIYELMGASLICLETSFAGCDKGKEATEAKRITLSGVEWTWIIAPRENIRNNQDLRIEVVP